MRELRSLITDYLEQAKLMQLATSVDGQPWVCSVWFATDEELNIYWFSSINRRHSEEIKKNPKVAGAFALPHEPEDAPRGLQFEGLAEELTDIGSIQRARGVYRGRIFDDRTIDGMVNNREKPHRFYRAKPTKFVLFDAANFPENARQEFEV